MISSLVGKSPLYNFKVWTILAYLLLIGVLIGSVAPIKTINVFDQSLGDKWLHISVYTLVGSYFFSCFSSKFKTFLFLIIFGITMEFFQFLTGHRFFELLDILANTIGTIAGLTLSHLFMKKLILKFDKLLTQHFH